jgi:hypothetical protein
MTRPPATTTRSALSSTDVDTERLIISVSDDETSSDDDEVRRGPLSRALMSTPKELFQRLTSLVYIRYEVK